MAIALIIPTPMKSWVLERPSLDLPVFGTMLGVGEPMTITKVLIYCLLLRVKVLLDGVEHGAMVIGVDSVSVLVMIGKGAC